MNFGPDTPAEQVPSSTPDVVAPTAPVETIVRRPSSRRQLVNLALVLAALVVPFLLFDAAGALFMVVALMAIIMFHEFAHFAVAKACGMKVTEYFLGFGPRLWSIKRGETEYGIKAIPAGGYVKIIGMSSIEVVEPQDERRAYRQQGWAKRVATIAAGPASHFLLAFFLLVGYFAWAGQPVGVAPEVGGVVVDSPAYAAGVRPGDRIVSVDGKDVRFFTDLGDAIGGSAGQPVAIVVSRGGEQVALTVTPKVTTDQGVTRPRIGISSAGSYVTETVGLGAAVPKAFSELGHSTRLTFEGLRGLVNPDRLRNYMHQVKTANTATGPVSDREVESRPTSVVGMVQIGGDAVGRSWSELLLILVAINLGLGMFNLIPMLPLDGGHIMLATWEAIMSKAKGRRHHADMTKVMPFAAAFLAILLVLGLSAMYLDIVRPV